MDKIEKIRQEIKRRIAKRVECVKLEGNHTRAIDGSVTVELMSLLSFLDTLGESSIEDCADALLNALSKSPYNNKPITDAQVIVKELLVFLKEPNKYNPDAILQETKVDLEKELDAWRHNHFKGKRDGHYSGEYLERTSQLDLARYFFELRKNAK